MFFSSETIFKFSESFSSDGIIVEEVFSTLFDISFDETAALTHAGFATVPTRPASIKLIVKFENSFCSELLFKRKPPKQSYTYYSK